MNTVWCDVRKQYVRTFDISDDTVCIHSMKYKAWEIFSLCDILTLNNSNMTTDLW